MEQFYFLVRAELTPKKREVISSEGSAFLLDPDGSCWSFGRNGYAQLGLGDIKERLEWTPTVLPAPLQKLILGNFSSLLITKEGKGYLTGRGRNALFNVPSENGQWNLLDLPCEKVRGGALGYFHSLLLSESGLCFGSAYNDSGQQGLGRPKEARKDWSVLPFPFPLKEVSCGGYYSLVCNEREEWYWVGYIGNETTGVDWVRLPTLEQGSIYSTRFHSFALLTKEGHYYLNAVKRLHSVQQGNQGMTNARVKKLYHAIGHSFLLTEEGACYALTWDNYNDALGVVPETVGEWTRTFSPEEPVEELIVSDNCTFLLTKKEKCYVAGGDYWVEVIAEKASKTSFFGEWYEFPLPFP